MNRTMDDSQHMPGLPDGHVLTRRTPVFTEVSVPPALLRAHRTAPGVWALIRVLEGRLLYRVLDPAAECVLEPQRPPGLIMPDTPHEVVPLGTVRFFVEFYRKPQEDRAQTAGGADTAEESDMAEEIYPAATREMAQKRRDLAPGIQAAFDAFGQKVFADGALSAKMKQIVAVAVAHVTQCPYCIKGHSKAALRAGATPEELMEAIWVAAEMRAGGAYAHSALMLATLDEERAKQPPERGG